MIAFWGFCVWVAIHSFTKGDLGNIKMMMDDDGIPCGREDKGTKNYPFAYFYQPLKKFGSIVCVNKCPQWTPDQ